MDPSSPCSMNDFPEEQSLPEPTAPTSTPFPSKPPFPLLPESVYNEIHISGAAATPNPAINLPNVRHSRSPEAWSTGLCDCCDDLSTCCLACCCPCIAFGRIAEIVDRGSTSCGVNGALYALLLCTTGCSCLYSCFYRSKMRGQYFLMETPCADCCVHCCCEHCALCQEYGELKSQGFDLSIGWHGNMERQKREAELTQPPVQPRMIR